MHDLLNMRGRVAIVTGGHAWLGNDMACALAEYGCDIIITSREQARADAAAAKIAETYGVKALGLTMDQTDYASVEQMAKKAFDWQQRIDVLINNAGGGSGKGECDFLRRDPATIRNMIDTNLTGALFCCRAVCGYMAEAKRGAVINIASIAALVGRDRAMYHDSNKMEQPVEYAAAKGGVIGMTQDLAAYMAPYGVRVNCISPGGFDKGDLPKAFTDAYGKATPLGRMGRMGEELKGAALYLASDASRYVTGHNLVVDGGFHICK
ncbi:MAG: SDR family oxidoreductase [Eubacteriales bacterium]|nr:SDR family oxidoreductase [Eubacteriales bacterium]